MAAVDLPDWPAPAQASVTLVNFGAQLTPGLGGPVQVIERMGSRFRLSVTMPPMRGYEARQWVAKLMQAQSPGARIEYPLQEFNPGLPGDLVKVNGGSQSGRTLNVDGLPDGYVFRIGQPISIEDAEGTHFLHFVTEEVIVGAPGTAALPIEPMLRVVFADNATVHVGKPMIEGLLQGNELPWTLDVAGLVGLSFDIMERK